MIRIIILFWCFIVFTPALAHAGLIRDAEVENTIRTLSDPIFEAAALDPAGVRVFIVANPAINAFVAGGANIFLHTGLLLATDKPEMLVGVVAHETGHIAGGHLARGAEQLEQATIGAVISYILGGVAVAAGAGDVGAAVMTGGSNVAERGMLAFTRTNEQAADAAALRYLETTDISARGLLEVFKLLQRNEKQRYGRLDPYALTHPLTRERVNNLRDYLSRTAAPDTSFSSEQQDRYQRMLGKLEGFLDEPRTVQQRYKNTVPTLRSNYALAISYFRQGDVEEAITLMRGLMQDSPEDGYYYDTLGQILFESGRINEAVEAYAKAATLKPKEAIIQTSYAQALLATEDAANLNESITRLELSARLDATFSDTWRTLAGAYGKAGKTGLRHLALAEEALLDNKLKTARTQSKLALDTLEKDSPARIRASDVNTLAIRELAKKEGENDE